MVVYWEEEGGRRCWEDMGQDEWKDNNTNDDANYNNNNSVV